MKDAQVRTRKGKMVPESSEIPSSPFKNSLKIVSIAVSILNVLVPLAAIVLSGRESKWPLIPMLAIVSLALSVFPYFYRKHRTQSEQFGFYERLLSSIRKKKDSAAPTAATTVIAALARRKTDQRQVATIALLLSLAVYAITRLRLELPLSVAIVAALAGGCILLQLADVALDYRIRRGLYGTNEYEARQIISFALNHAERSNLSGGLGAADIKIDAATEKLVHENWGVATS